MLHYLMQLLVIQENAIHTIPVMFRRNKQKKQKMKIEMVRNAIVSQCHLISKTAQTMNIKWT
jgi:hypothetical protein